MVKQFQSNKDFADRRKKVISARTYFYEDEHKCDVHLETFLNCIDAVGKSGSGPTAIILCDVPAICSSIHRLARFLKETKKPSCRMHCILSHSLNFNRLCQ